MAVEELALPLIDISRYFHPETPTDRGDVIAQVCDACRKYGFVQIQGHGVPIEVQQGLLRSIDRVFDQSKEEKLKLSFLDNPCRRGYEASGMSLRDGDALPDSKESYFIGREDPVIEPPGFYGPNVWPDLPNTEFREPAEAYYTKANALGRAMWEILMQGLGHAPSVLEKFGQRPMVMMKLIRYPPSSQTLPDQFGIGAHTDFGGITILLQQPGREGLEVWHDKAEKWVPVPAVEDVLVVNCGNIVQKWTNGAYKSAWHRVVNKSDAERKSCAVFWHGDAKATNPLSDDPDQETVGQLLVKRFRNQYSLSKEVYN